jgi:hypothetical protein
LAELWETEPAAAVAHLFRTDWGHQHDRPVDVDPVTAAAFEQEATMSDPMTPIGDGLLTVRLADVKPELVEWVWPSYLPAGKLVILDGDPGLGKSTLALDLAARITTGSPMPDGNRPRRQPGTVVLLSAEDGLADTIRPRVEAAAGDAHRIQFVDAVQYVDDEGQPHQRPPSLPIDVERLERLVAVLSARLVIIDVLAAYLDARVNSFRDQDVRLALHPLSKMADRTGATVLVLRHLNKTGGPNALYRGGGSIGITGAARAVLMLGVDPSDDTRRVLAVVKSNLAAVPTALAYRLVPDELHGCAHVQWEGPTDTGADDLVAPVDHEERTARTEAEEFLLELLEDGSVPATEAKSAARETGIAESTLKRAKAKLGVRSSRHGYQAPWVWTLPNSKGTYRRPHPEMDTIGPLSGSDPGGGVVHTDRYEADYPDLFRQGDE